MRDEEPLLRDDEPELLRDDEPPLLRDAPLLRDEDDELLLRVELPPDRDEPPLEREEPPLDREDELLLREDELRDDELRDEDAEPGLRSFAGTSSLITSRMSVGICFSMNFCIRSSWRRYSLASFTVSLSPSWSAAASITL